VSTVHTEIRNATIEDIVEILRGQHARKVDLVAPAKNFAAADGRLHVTGADWIVDEDGATDPNRAYLPTKVADEGIARIFGIPNGYFRRLRDTNTAAWDHSVNDWLEHPDYADKKYLLRGLRADGDTPAVLRAVLSDSYGMIDHLDALFATLDGIAEADQHSKESGGPGVQVEIERCDLSDGRLYVAFRSDQVTAMAPKLLEAYRSPFDGPNPIRRVGQWDLRSGLAAADREGLGYNGAEPVLSAGFILTNSETGLGRYTLSPYLTARVCRNGLILREEGIARQHLGQKLDEGLVPPSRRTQTKLLELITAQTSDAVAKFLDVEWLAATVRRLEQHAGVAVEDPEATVQVVVKRLGYSQDRQSAILAAFLRGGQPTAAGVANAVTAVAQTLGDPDEAYQMESDAVRAMEVAAGVR
jgi:hypothetical protein